MKRSLTIVAFLAALSLGVFAAIALADTGAVPGDTTTGQTTGADTNATDSTSSSTGTDTGTVDGTTTGTSTTAPTKVWLCHRTHAKKRPYRLIHVSAHAEAAHLKHGDFVAAAGADCAAPLTSSSTSTDTTTTNTATHGHGAGKSGVSHGKGHH